MSHATAKEDRAVPKEDGTMPVCFEIHADVKIMRFLVQVLHARWNEFDRYPETS